MLSVVVLTFLAGSGVPHARGAPTAPERYEQWLKLVTGGRQVGFAHVRTDPKNADSFTLLAKLGALEQKKIVEVELKCEFVRTNAGWRPQRIELQLDRAGTRALLGELVFDVEKQRLTESYRRAADGEMVVREHAYGGEAVLIPSAIAVLGPLILNTEGAADVLLLQLPHGTSGPLLSDEKLSGKLTRKRSAAGATTFKFESAARGLVHELHAELGANGGLEVETWLPNHRLEPTSEPLVRAWHREQTKE
ncbi:MAG: hypothetical protein ACKVX7_10600 [Planctomycetota bacterium]